MNTHNPHASLAYLHSELLHVQSEIWTACAWACVCNAAARGAQLARVYMLLGHATPNSRPQVPSGQGDLSDAGEEVTKDLEEVIGNMHPSSQQCTGEGHELQACPTGSKVLCPRAATGAGHGLEAPEVRPAPASTSMKREEAGRQRLLPKRCLGSVTGF